MPGLFNWIQQHLPPESKRDVDHFDHAHTPEEAKACLGALRSSVRPQLRAVALWICLQLLLTVAVSVVFEHAWQWWVFFAWLFFAGQLLAQRSRALRKPVEWPCGRTAVIADGQKE